MIKIKMDFNKKKYYLDIVMFVSFLVSALSGLVLFFILPKGTGSDSFIFLRYEWIEIHNWSSFALIFIVLIHLIFNFGWIKAMTKNLFRWIK